MADFKMPRFDIRIEAPREIKRLIGQDGWQQLSMYLHYGYVQDAKHYLSEKRGYDVGIPEAVWHLCNPSRGLSEPSSDEHFRRLLTIGYLLGTDFVSSTWQKIDSQRGWEQTGIVPDEHGDNQLEGELRRYWARKTGLQPGDVELNEVLWMIIAFTLSYMVLHTDLKTS